MRNDKPTGKWRLKTLPYGWRGKEAVAVEIEVEWEDGGCDHNGMPEYLGGKGWRLAQPDDLLRMKLNENQRANY